MNEEFVHGIYTYEDFKKDEVAKKILAKKPLSPEDKEYIYLFLTGKAIQLDKKGAKPTKKAEHFELAIEFIDEYMKNPSNMSSIKKSLVDKYKITQKSPSYFWKILKSALETYKNQLIYNLECCRDADDYGEYAYKWFNTVNAIEKYISDAPIRDKSKGVHSNISL